MNERRTRTVTRFVEGKGHLVEEQPIETSGHPDARPVNAPPAAPPQPVTIAMSSLVLEDLTKELESRGFVVVPATEFQDQLDRIGELEKEIDHLANGGAAVPDPGRKGKGKKKGKTMSADEVKKQIAEATDLDQLTAIMKDVEDKELLALADARADEMTEGGQ